MFDRLFEKGRIGNMTIRNRIVMPPMYTGMACGGYATEQLHNYLCARAAGGAGMIIIEMTLIEQAGQLYPNQPAIFDDSFIPALGRMVDAIHKNGAKVGMQLGHAGALAYSVNTGMQPASASATKSFWGELARELSIDEIRRLTDAFVGAAVRARQAGVDGVEVHCAHGYLLRQFLSPYSNHRTDAYGGSLENRARFPLEVIRGIRQEMGNKYPVWFRINGKDFVRQDGFTLNDCKKVSRWMEEAGADAVSISAGTYESPVNMSIQPMIVRRGCLLPLSASVKKAVNIPVIVAGRINTPDLAERALHGGKADFIAMGRELIADPEFPAKAAAGRVDEIRHCLSCNECVDHIELTGADYRVSCTVNAELGMEDEYGIKRAPKPKKILVIGGGPAGMEAARVAAVRGHKVTLYEKERRLGGQAVVAARGYHKGGLTSITRFLSRQLKETGVKVRLGQEASLATAQKENPDVIILAAGASPLIPPIPGIKANNVVTANDVLTGKAATGKTVIVIGGGMVGLEVAEVLARKGREVTVVEMLSKLGADMNFSFRPAILRTLRGLQVRLLASAKAVELKDDTLFIDKEGERAKLKADTFVLAVGSCPNNGLARLLKDHSPLYIIGDCASPRKIKEAIAEGARVGREI